MFQSRCNGFLRTLKQGPEHSRGPYDLLSVKDNEGLALGHHVTAKGKGRLRDETLWHMSLRASGFAARALTKVFMHYQDYDHG